MKYSIIVVAYNIENFIEECLESCVFPSRNDYEVIVIYNASTDRTLDSIKRVTTKYPSIFKIIENDDNVGLGEGRNQGMRAAAGDYYIFVDGDDFLTADALPAIADRVEREKPDVLVINFVRFHQDGRPEANGRTKFLTEGRHDSLDSRRLLLRNFGVAWNKVYSRAFVDRHNLSFPTCYYEDIVWNAECVMRARSIYVTPKVLINYRQRPGSILRSTDERHFDTILQHRRIVDILANEPDLAKAYGEELRRYSRHQMFATLHIGGRIPKGSEDRFLSELTETLARYDRVIGKKRKFDLREYSASHGSHSIYSIYRFGDLTEARARKYYKNKLSKPIDQWVHRSFKWWYRYVFQKMPIKDNRVVFDSFWGQRPDGNPLAIHRALADYPEFDCAYMLQRKAKVGEADSIVRVGRSSFKGYLYLATAKYLVTNSAFPDDYVKRPGQIMLQTQHGTPFKYMGLQQRLVQPNATNWWRLALRTRIWDYVISSNKYSTSVWRKAYPYNYNIIESGYPANDMLANLDPALVERVRQSIGIPSGKKVALYAPTFRDNQRGQQVNVGRVMDTKRLLDALGPEYVLLARSHYFAKGTNVDGNRLFDVSDYPITNEILAVTDLLITDYSSIAVDYGVLDRPAILYAYDADDYKRDRGMYLELEEFNPGVIAHNLKDLCDVIARREYDSPESGMRRAEFRERFCSLDDGRATERVLQEVFGVKPVETQADVLTPAPISEERVA